MASMELEFTEETDYLQDLVCNLCDAEFLDKEDLEVHIKQLHLNEANKNRFCELCTYIFNDIEEYALHLRDIHFTSLKCCKYCTRLFNTTSEVQEHEKKHKSAALYPKVSCSQCDDVFDSKTDTRDHELKEHIDCTDGLMLRDSLPILSSLLCMNIEKFLIATTSNLPFSCVVCTKTTVDIKEYIQHLVVSNKCLGYSCNECHSVYKNKYRIARHAQTHNNDGKDTKEFLTQCKKCKLPLKAGELKSHVKKCSGMYCTLCEKYFDSVFEYTNHRLTEHKTRWPSVEVCIYCQRQMIGADNLKKHVNRVHKNEIHLYKYHCTDCNRLYKHPKFLFAHFFSKHKNLHPYTCKICNKKFRVRKGFSLHIKLTHNSEGNVEFDDNFHVYFTDKKFNKSTKEAVLDDEKEGPNGDQHSETSTSREDESENKCENEVDSGKMKKHKDTLEQSVTETDLEIELERDVKDKTNGCENIDEITEKSIKRKRRCVLKRKHVVKKVQSDYVSGDDVFSDDSDIPLHAVSKKLKSQKIKKRRLRRTKLADKKLFCDTCNKNCYTYQNYHRHKALHGRNETKVCIKCYGKFDSVKKLNNHIKKEHSSSQLTETLKKVLEKRKLAEETSKKIANTKKYKSESSNDIQEIPHEVVTLSTSEKFQNTMKKVIYEKNTSTKVTMKLVDNISVKKYLENFMSDSNDVKIAVIKEKDPSDKPGVKKPRHLIKLTKFNDTEMQESQEIKLKMPVKFTDDLQEKFDVSIKLVPGYQQPAMTFYNEIDNNYIENDDNYTCNASEPEEENKEVIPEVAQEIMLEGFEESNRVVHTVTFKNVSNLSNVAIAHLSSEAPYFKIAKINLGSDGPITLKPEKTKTDQKVETPKDITLPNGKRLVNVNPFHHLLNKKAIDELASSKKTRKDYYKPKIRDVAKALTTALLKLDSDKNMEKKKV